MEARNCGTFYFTSKKSCKKKESDKNDAKNGRVKKGRKIHTPAKTVAMVRQSA